MKEPINISYGVEMFGKDLDSYGANYFFGPLFNKIEKSIKESNLDKVFVDVKLTISQLGK